MPNELATTGTQGKTATMQEDAGLRLTMDDVERLKSSVQAFNKLKNDILKVGVDKVTIKGKEAITRSGYSKIALAFGISTEIRNVQRLRDSDNYIVMATVRAYSPQGRFSDGQGVCSALEMIQADKKWLAGDTNVEHIASTRARERAIADLTGGSIVSAEELDPTFEPKEEAAVAPQKPTPPSNPDEEASVKAKNYLLGLAHKKWGQQEYNPKLTILMGYYFDTVKHPHTDVEHLKKGDAYALIEALKSPDPDLYVKAIEAKT